MQANIHTLTHTPSRAIEERWGTRARELARCERQGARGLEHHGTGLPKQVAVKRRERLLAVEHRSPENAKRQRLSAGAGA